MNVDGFLNNWQEVAGGVFEDNAEEIIAENIMQLRRGLKPDGEYAGTYDDIDNNDYAYFKRHSGGEPYGWFNTYDLPVRPYGIVNLGNRGDFYRSLFVNVSNGEVRIDTTDPKWDTKFSKKTPLREVYGEDVLGIPDEYFNGTLREKIVDALIILLRD